MSIYKIIRMKWRELKSIWSDLGSVLKRIDKLNKQIAIDMDQNKWDTLKEQEIK